MDICALMHIKGGVFLMVLYLAPWCCMFRSSKKMHSAGFTCLRWTMQSFFSYLFGSAFVTGKNRLMDRNWTRRNKGRIKKKSENNNNNNKKECQMPGMLLVVGGSSNI